MSHDEELSQRIREVLAGEPDVTEMAMFGGLAFLAAGHMAVAASGQGGLMLRCHADDTDALVAEPFARPFEMRGKAMRGWLRVDAEGAATSEELVAWIWPAIAYARSLPPKV